MKVTNKHILFWRDVFSNWTVVPGGIWIEEDPELYFPTTEHLFMYYKAIFFEDYDTAEKMLHVTTPKEVKKLGRKVKGYVESRWMAFREEAMYTAVKYRLEYDKAFSAALMNPDYKNKILVEASPYDKIWGIGLEENDPDADNETKWRGMNLLGKTLTRLKNEEWKKRS